MKIFVLATSIALSQGNGLPFPTKAECEQAKAMMAYTLRIPIYAKCHEVDKTPEHQKFYDELAERKRALDRARQKRQIEAVARLVVHG